MSTPTKYRALAAVSTAEFRDRGSRFLAFVYPVKTIEEVKAHVRQLKAEHPKAAHHCVAYRLGHDGSQYRAGDDGEPSGSAGRPMLGAINSAGLTNTLVVVVRYFGGTLLGVPGLINAYGSVAAAAIAAAPVSEYWVEKNFSIECDYASTGEVLHVLRKEEATLLRQDMQLFCVIDAGIPVHKVEPVLRQLSDIRGVLVKAL